MTTTRKRLIEQSTQRKQSPCSTKHYISTYLSKHNHMLRNACLNVPKLLTVTGVALLFIVIVFDRSVPLIILPSALSTTFRISEIFTSSVPSHFTTMAHSSRSYHTVAKPPNSRELGNAGWTLIHSIAANFPEEPSEHDQYYAKAFLKSVAKLYPCRKCRYHFDKYIAASPPDVSSRTAFVLWACEAHNDVNRRKGKREFPCHVRALEHRWGDCGCQRKK